MERTLSAGRRVPVLLVALVLAAAGCSTSQPTGEPDPDSPLGLTEQATHAYLLGQTEKAVDLCRRALAEDPSSARAQLVMGMAFRLAADRTSGVERDTLRREELAAMTKAAELDPSDLAARVDLASSLLEEGQRQRAEEQLRRAIALAPGKPWTKTISPLNERDEPAASSEQAARAATLPPAADPDQQQEP